MATWIFEPGHTEAEFRARHMMVTWVRGLFKDIHGQLELDWDRCLDATFEGEIDATGDLDRRARPRRPPAQRRLLRRREPPEDRLQRPLHRAHRRHRLQGRGRADDPRVTRTVPLDVSYIGEWKTPWWDGDENKGEMRRIGFEATARIDRHDFGVSWQDEIPGGGVVVSNEIELTLDVEAILLDDLERTGAIEYYMPARARA